MKAAVVNELGQAPRYQDFAEPNPRRARPWSMCGPRDCIPSSKRWRGLPLCRQGRSPHGSGRRWRGHARRWKSRLLWFARKPWGTMCEQTVAPRSKCLPLPDNLDDTLAAAIANPGMSAWLSLKERAAVARVRPF